jgi:hypothetical protein
MKTLYRWEQDGAGGEYGTATFFPDTPHEVVIHLPNFKESHDLSKAIVSKLVQTSRDARAGLLAEIGRIKP